MRRWSLVLLAVGFVGCASPRGSAGSSSAAMESAVLEAEQDWYTAMVQKDAARIDALLTEDFVMSGLNPSLETRAQYLQTIQTPDSTLKPFALEDRRVRIYGDSAVSTGRAQLEGIWNERPLALTFRYTNIFILRDGHWRVVASHVSKVEP